MASLNRLTGVLCVLLFLPAFAACGEDESENGAAGKGNEGGGVQAGGAAGTSAAGQGGAAGKGGAAGAAGTLDAGPGGAGGASGSDAGADSSAQGGASGGDAGPDSSAQGGASGGAGADAGDEAAAQAGASGDGGTQGLSVIPTPDDTRATTVHIAKSGGEIVVVTADGTELALVIPPGALLHETDITVTPLTQIGAIPFAGPMLGAAKFEPEGLQFFVPATLRITPSAVIPATTVGFAYTAEGSDFHLIPVRKVDATLELDLWHFSGAGATGATPLELAQAAANPTGSAVSAAEQAQALGADPAKTIAALTAAYDNDVGPDLNDCLTQNEQLIEAAFVGFLRWIKLGELAGVSGDSAIASRRAGGDGLSIKAIQRAIDLANERCINNQDWTVMRDVLFWAAIAQLTGYDSEANKLDYQGILDRSCVKVKVDASFPDALAGEMALDVTSGFQLGTGAPQFNPPLAITVTTVNGAAAPGTGSTDSAGKFLSTITANPNVNDVSVEVRSCMTELDVCSIAKRTATTKPVISVLGTRAVGSQEPPSSENCAPNSGSVEVVARLMNGLQPQPSKSVTFSVSGGGSLSANGVTTDANGEARVVYTAPSTGNGIATVNAQSTLSGGTATTSYSFNYGLKLGVSPAEVDVGQNASQQFQAINKCGGQAASATWSATGGDITSQGLYTAYNAAGDFTVTATSTTDSSMTAEAIVHVTDPNAQAYAACGGWNYFDVELKAEFRGTLDSFILDPAPVSIRYWDAKRASYNYCNGTTVKVSIAPSQYCFKGWEDFKDCSVPLTQHIACRGSFVIPSTLNFVLNPIAPCDASSFKLSHASNPLPGRTCGEWAWQDLYALELTNRPYLDCKCSGGIWVDAASCPDMANHHSVLEGDRSCTLRAEPHADGPHVCTVYGLGTSCSPDCDPLYCDECD